MKQHPMWLVVCLVLFWECPLFACGRGENVLLVHGAWHGAWAWHVTASKLEASGCNVSTPELPGHGIDGTPAGLVTLDDYVAAVVTELDSLAEPAVLVGHSMGGVVISQVAEERPDLVEKLVYLAAFMPRDGESMFSLASQDLGSLALADAIIDPTAGLVDLHREHIGAMFYGQCPPEYVALAQSLLRPNPLGPIVTPVALTEANFGSVPRYYIKTTDDFAVTPVLQELMLENQPGAKIFELDSDHSPFFSRPNRLHALLRRIIRDR